MMRANPTLRIDSEPRLAVVIGARRAQMRDVEQLVSTLPSDADMTFVLAHRLDAKETQRLREVLAEASEIAIDEPEGRVELRPNTLHLVGPSVAAEFDEDTGLRFTRVEDQDADSRSLFEAVAARFGSHTAGVVLSAEDADSGLEAIARAAGLTIARTPRDGSSDSAESQPADLVLDIPYMPRALARFSQSLAYAEGHAFLAAIVASSDDAIVSKTLDGIIMSWNAGAERIFGYTAEEAVGQSIELIIPPELRDEETEILSKLRRGERIDHFETTRVAKDGRRLNISLTISPIRDASGRIVAASKVARDVTEQKRAEAALREADKRKDEYLAMLGHELRNPLAAIQSAGEVIRHGCGDDPLTQKGVAILARQSSHMAKLLDGLLDVSRITRGKLQVDRAPMELRGVLNDVLAGGKRKAAEEGIELRGELGGEPLRVLGDSTRLTQVFGNLVDNALKFTGPNGLVCVKASATDDTIEVSVEDNGAGFTPQTGEYLFEAFRQGPQDFSRSRGGLGLGLALAHGIVELHGGTIEAYSEGKNKGATFTVRLPRVSAETATNLTPAEQPAGVSSIVLIEDNQDLAIMLRERLEMQGHTVRAACTGEEGLELARRYQPDIVVCDLGLPGKITGFEVARELRADALTRSATLVALSGYGHEQAKAAGEEAGFDIHITKPVDFKTLAQVLGKQSAAKDKQPAAQG